MGNEFIFVLLKTLLLTIIVEILFLFIQKEKDYKVYIICIIMNIITNLSFNIGNRYLPVENYNLYIILLEILIVIIEGFIYFLHIRKPLKAFRLAFICNLASYLIGILLSPYLY